jgi:hypothetical protein
MAENMVAGLFGLTPEMYGEQQRRSALNEGITLAQLSPSARGTAMIYGGAKGLGNAIAGLMGVEDPMLNRITQQDQLLRGLDLTNPKSLLEGAKIASQMNNPQLAAGLVDRAKSLQESSGRIALQNAQLLKAMQPAKLTGDERYITTLRNIETKIAAGETPSQIELSDANIAGQMLSKPRSYFDQASGQMVTQAATDPSKAFPLAYKAMGASSEEKPTTVPKPTVQQATTGNLPSGSQAEIGVIDANLKKLEQSAPELQSFLTSLKSNEVKYNAKDNTFDFLGAIIPPAFGFKEQGGQVKKDEIKRALTERVNTLLLMAKGTQTEGDATRAKDQIASDTTYLSQARMIGAIEGLERTEKKLQAELLAKKGSLQSQGKPTTPVEQPATAVEQPTTQARQPSPSAPQKTPSKPTELSREQKIDLFIKANGGKPTRKEAEDYLRSMNKL